MRMCLCICVCFCVRPILSMRLVARMDRNVRQRLGLKFIKTLTVRARMISRWSLVVVTAHCRKLGWYSLRGSATCCRVLDPWGSQQTETSHAQSSMRVRSWVLICSILPSKRVSLWNQLLCIISGREVRISFAAFDQWYVLESSFVTGHRDARRDRSRLLCWVVSWVQRSWRWRLSGIASARSRSIRMFSCLVATVTRGIKMLTMTWASRLLSRSWVCV